MKRIAIALLFVMVAASAQATTIQDIQTGLVTVGDAVTLTNVVVTAERYNGIFVAEAPYGPNNHIWVYSGGAPGATVGDLVDLSGIYAEYYDFSEIDSPVISVVGSTTTPAPIMVPGAVLFADPEPYESCLITIPDEMVVTQINSYGEWEATLTGDASILTFDDYWYDDTTVMLGDCYSSVTGVLVYSFGTFKLELLVDGIVGCPVADEPTSFGAIKSLFR